MKSERKQTQKEPLFSPTSVVLRPDGVFPASFENNNIVIDIKGIQGSTTKEERQNGQKNTYDYFRVLTEEGQFELKRNTRTNEWLAMKIIEKTTT